MCESPGKPFKRWVLLRPKMYSMQNHLNEDIKKAKGVNSSVIKNNIKFDDYIQVFKSKGKMDHYQSNIISKSHCIYTIRKKKSTLNF